MPESYIPSQNINTPDSVTLADITQTFNSVTGIQFPTRWLNIKTLLGAGVSSVTGTADRITVIPTTGDVIVNIAESYVGQTSITTLGTITTGTWNATAIGATKGGTAQTTYATGDLLYASALNTLSKRAIGSSGQILTVSGGIPTWATDLGTGTVTSVSVVTNQGVSGVVATATTTPAITLSLGALTGVTSLNGLIVTANTGAITTGTWNATVISPIYGGTGVANNASSTLTISGNFATTLTVSASTSLTLPTSGTVFSDKASSITSAQFLSACSDETGTGILVFGTSPTFTTDITSPLIIGGTAVGSTLNFKGTSGNGTSSVAAVNLLVGNNGATTALKAFNSGQVDLTSIGTNGISFQGLVGTTTSSAVYFNLSTPSASNYTLASSAAGQTLLNGSSVLIQVVGASRYTISSTGHNVVTGQGIAGTSLYMLTCSNNASQTAGSNIPKAIITLGTCSWLTGALAQADFYQITQPSILFSGASTATLVSTVSIKGAPIASTNATVTTSVGLLIESGTSVAVGTTTAYGAYINAPTGATTNIALGISGHQKFVTSTALLGTSSAGMLEYNNSFYITKNSTLRFGLGGVIFDNSVDAGNVTTGETDLYSYTMPASTLASNGEKIQAEYGGIFVSSATATRDIKLYFAGTAIFDTGTLTLSLSSAWCLYVTIIRVSASVIRYSISLTTEGAALAAYTAVGELTGLTLNNTNILKITGQASGVGAATGDITAKLGHGTWFASANN